MLKSVFFVGLLDLCMLFNENAQKRFFFLGLLDLYIMYAFGRPHSLCPRGLNNNNINYISRIFSPGQAGHDGNRFSPREGRGCEQAGGQVTKYRYYQIITRGLNNPEE